MDPYNPHPHQYRDRREIDIIEGRNPVPKPPRVHFNPVVSQLRYCHHSYYATPTCQDPQQNQRSLRHGERPNEDQVQKVLVTIAVAPTQHRVTDNFPPTPVHHHNNQQCVPDLLKSTPQFGRRNHNHSSYTRSGKTRYPHPTSTTTNRTQSQPCFDTLGLELLGGDPQPEVRVVLNNPTLLSSLTSTQNQNTRDPRPPPLPPSSKLSISKLWKSSSLSERLGLLKKYIIRSNKENNNHLVQQSSTTTHCTTLQQPRGIGSTGTPNLVSLQQFHTLSGSDNQQSTTTAQPRASTRSRSDAYSTTVERNPICETPQKEPLLDNHDVNNVNVSSVIPSFERMMNSAPAGVTSTSKRRNQQIPVGQGQRLELEESEEEDTAGDELSLNADRILEDIADLENAMEQQQQRRIQEQEEIRRMDTTDAAIINNDNNSVPSSSRESQIAELLRECNELSSALSNLTFTADSNSNLSSEEVDKGNDNDGDTNNEVESTNVEVTLHNKPPLPPYMKGKYFDNSAAGRRTQFLGLSHSPHSSEYWCPPEGRRKPEPLKARAVDRKLLKVKADLLQSRERVSNFHPNLEEIEDSVRSCMSMIDRSGRNLPTRTVVNSGWESSTSSLISQSSSSDHHQQRRYGGDNATRQSNWDSVVARAKEKLVVSSTPAVLLQIKDETGFTPTQECRTGILETDLDTGTSREILKSDSFSFCESRKQPAWSPPLSSALGVVKSTNSFNKLQHSSRQSAYSMQNLHVQSSSSTLSPAGSGVKEDRSRSMEFLMDEEKQAQLMPPENTLKKNHEERKVSEHELRIQRSLQRLNVPDWYKSYATPSTPGTPGSTGKGKEFGSGTGLAGGWSGLSSSKTSSWTSLHSAGRYAGSKTQFSSVRSRGTKDSLMSPSSTASASPSPYYERSSFTRYGMPYALSRFATARMSCGASPASLSPSPSPVGGITSSTSTPVSSGPMSRYSYHKTPYLGWRSQERLTSKSLYRSPSERLAADLITQKQKTTPATTPVTTDSEASVSVVTSPRKETASDLSLNISDTSESSNKLNRVRSSIKAVSNAIVDYVNETKPLDESINGRASPRRGLVWLESSFVGTKPIDSPGTPDTSAVVMSKHLEAQGTAYLNSKRSSMKLEHNGDTSKDKGKPAEQQSQAFSTFLARNEKVGERSNTSSVSSPTLDDILDSLLALRRPQKKFRSKGPKDTSSTKDDYTPVTAEPLPSRPPPTSTSPAPPSYDIPLSDWQKRINAPLDETMYFPQDSDDNAFLPSTTVPALSSLTTESNNSSTVTTSTLSASAHNKERISYMHALDDTIGAVSDLKLGSEKGTNDGALFEYDDTNAIKSPWMDINEKEEPKEDHETQKIAQEESTFGTITEINPPAVPTLINNPLANLTENTSNPPTPAKHRRVSFDLDTSDKEEKSSSRSKRDDTIGNMIQCKNSKCGKTATGLEARRDFKTCHNCNAYYCSRECRRLHWEKHKKVCMQSRVGQLCKQIITHVKEDSFVVSHLSTVAKRGYLAKGRGSVKLFFSSPDRAERFLTGGLPELPEPWYIPHGEMLPEEMGATIFTELSDSCRTYNPETRFVIYVSVCVVNEVPTSGAVKWEREMISRCSKIRLLIPRSFDENQPHHHAANPAHLNPGDIDPSSFSPTHQPASRGGGGGGAVLSEDGSTPREDNETLILSSVPIAAALKNTSDDRRRREVSFTNIQKHLLDRGVDLRRTYPDIYSKLCNYVENNEPFIPVTIYPRNSITGGQFMCVIMPESTDTAYGQSADPSRRVETINVSSE